MSDVLLYKPSAEAELVVSQAIEKMENIYSRSVSFGKATNSAEVSYQFTSLDRKYRLVFLFEEHKLEELSGIVEVFKRHKVHFVTVSGNNEGLKAVTTGYLHSAKNALSPEFIFSAMRNTLVPDADKIDLRVLKFALLSVISVIEQNTKIRLQAMQPAMVESEATTSDMTGVFGFFSDGICGTLTLTTSRKLASLLAVGMIKADPSKVDDPMLLDVFCELGDQVFGEFTQSLATHNYEFRRTVQIVAVGEAHTHKADDAGKHYRMPFKYENEPFVVTLSYNPVRTWDDFSEFGQDIAGDEILDIRLVNYATKFVSEAIAAVTGCVTRRVNVGKYTTILKESDTVYAAHSIGKSGGFLLAINVPRATSAHVARRMADKATPDKSVPAGDPFDLALKQAHTKLKAAAETVGYGVQQVFYGRFASATKFLAMLRNRGYYLNIEFTVDDQPFSVCFGTKGSHERPCFDLWSYFDQASQF